MSYILDALKRAHAERGGSASSTTQPSGLQALGLSSPRGRRSLPQGAMLLGLGLLLIAALTTWWLRKDRVPAQAITPAVVVAAAPAPVDPPVNPSPPPVAPVDAAPSPVPASQSPRPFVGPTRSAAPVLRPPPMPANATDGTQNPAPTQGQSAARGAALMPIQGRPVGPREAAPAATPAEAASDATSTMAPGALPAPGAGVPAAPPAMPVTAPAPAQAPQAPPSVTRSITTNTAPGGPTGALASDSGLKVTGATYSENPAHRLLIVNGKVVKEGQEVEPGLVLEVISPRSAVFKRQGTRFNVNY